MLTRRDVVDSIDLNTARPYKIRLLESNDENTDEEAERRSTAVPSILKLMLIGYTTVIQKRAF